MEDNKEGQQDDDTLCELIFRWKGLAILLCAGMLLSGCGRQWEHFWGQDTRPETRYIPLTPDFIEIGIGSLNPVQWADRRFKDARYRSVWACNAQDVCAQMPILGQDPSGPDCYVLLEGSLLSVYNVQQVYPLAVKIKVQVVL